MFYFEVSQYPLTIKKQLIICFGQGSGRKNGRQVFFETTFSYFNKTRGFGSQKNVQIELNMYSLLETASIWFSMCSTVKVNINSLFIFFIIKHQQFYKRLLFKYSKTSSLQLVCIFVAPNYKISLAVIDFCAILFQLAEKLLIIYFEPRGCYARSRERATFF